MESCKCHTNCIEEIVHFFNEKNSIELLKDLIPRDVVDKFTNLVNIIEAYFANGALEKSTFRLFKDMGIFSYENDKWQPTNAAKSLHNTIQKWGFDPNEVFRNGNICIGEVYSDRFCEEFDINREQLRRKTCRYNLSLSDTEAYDFYNACDIYSQYSKKQLLFFW